MQPNSITDMAPISPRNKRKQEDTAVVVRPKKFIVLVEGDVPDSDGVDEPCPSKSDGEDHQDHPDCNTSVHVARTIDDQSGMIKH